MPRASSNVFPLIMPDVSKLFILFDFGRFFLCLTYRSCSRFISDVFSLIYCLSISRKYILTSIFPRAVKNRCIAIFKEHYRSTESLKYMGFVKFREKVRAVSPKPAKPEPNWILARISRIKRIGI